MALYRRHPVSVGDKLCDGIAFAVTGSVFASYVDRLYLTPIVIDDKRPLIQAQFADLKGPTGDDILATDSSIDIKVLGDIHGPAELPRHAVGPVDNERPLDLEPPALGDDQCGLLVDPHLEFALDVAIQGQPDAARDDSAFADQDAIIYVVIRQTPGIVSGPGQAGAVASRFPVGGVAPQSAVPGGDGGRSFEFLFFRGHHRWGRGLNFTGDLHIREHDIFSVPKVHDGPLLQCVDGDVFDEDVENERGFYALQGYRLVVTRGDMHVLDIDVADLCRIVAAAIPVVVVSQSENPGLADIEVFDIDILNKSAPIQVRLTVQHVAAFILAVVEKDVAHPSGNLTTDGDTAKVRWHVAYDNIFARPTFTPGAVVPTGLDRQAVVALVQPAVFHQHIGTRVGVEPIVVRVVTVDDESSYRDIRAVGGLNAPEGIIENRHVFDEHIGTFEGFEKRRLPVNPDVFHRDVSVVHLPQFFVCRRSGLELQGPQAPGVFRLSVERALSGEGNIGLLVRVDQG